MTLKIIFAFMLLLVLSVGVLMPSAYTDELPEYELSKELISILADGDDTPLRLDTLELVTGIQANDTSHENRIAQNESDILFLFDWYYNVMYAVEKLLDYDLDVMRGDLDKNIDLTATNAIDIGTHVRMIDTNINAIALIIENQETFTRPDFHFNYKVMNSTVMTTGSITGTVTASCNNNGVQDPITVISYFNTIPDMDTLGTYGVDWIVSTEVIRVPTDPILGNLNQMLPAEAAIGGGFKIEFLIGNATQDITLQTGIQCEHPLTS